MQRESAFNCRKVIGKNRIRDEGIRRGHRSTNITSIASTLSQLINQLASKYLVATYITVVNRELPIKNAAGRSEAVELRDVHIKMDATLA